MLKLSGVEIRQALGSAVFLLHKRFSKKPPNKQHRHGHRIAFGVEKAIQKIFEQVICMILQSPEKPDVRRNVSLINRSAFAVNIGEQNPFVFVGNRPIVLPIVD